MAKKENAMVVLVVVLVLVVFGFWALNKGTDTTPAPYNNTIPSGTTGTTTNSNVTPSEDTSAGSIHAGAPAASISYQNALATYKDARLQLDANCQSDHDKMTFKNNAFMMIDNRAPVPRTVKVGSVFPVAAFSFKILKLSSPTLPVTWLVDCDKSQNVASILIEK